jgi:hypothetical protein
MRGRLVRLLVILSMLSACAGKGDRPHARYGAHDAARQQSLDQALGERPFPTGSTAAVPDRRQVRHHYHEEPDPDDVYAGQIALLLSAQVFACAFFVVILDGACNFNVGTSYYY